MPGISRAFFLVILNLFQNLIVKFNHNLKVQVDEDLFNRISQLKVLKLIF